MRLAWADVIFGWIDRLGEKIGEATGKIGSIDFWKDIMSFDSLRERLKSSWRDVEADEIKFFIPLASLLSRLVLSSGSKLFGAL